MHLLRLAICLLTATFIACDDPGPAAQRADQGAGQGADQGADLGADLDVSDLPAEPAAPARWEVVVAPAAPEAVRWAADDVTGYLNAMGATAALKADAALTCAPGARQGGVCGRRRGRGDADAA